MRQTPSSRANRLRNAVFITVWLFLWLYLLSQVSKDWHFPVLIILYTTFFGATYLLNYYLGKYNCRVSTGPNGYKIIKIGKRSDGNPKTQYFAWEDMRHYYVDKVPKGGYELHIFTNSGEETVFEDVNTRRFYNYLKLNFPEKNSGEELLK